MDCSNQVISVLFVKSCSANIWLLIQYFYTFYFKYLIIHLADQVFKFLVQLNVFTGQIVTICLFYGSVQSKGKPLWNLNCKSQTNHLYFTLMSPHPRIALHKIILRYFSTYIFPDKNCQYIKGYFMTSSNLIWISEYYGTSLHCLQTNVGLFWILQTEASPITNQSARKLWIFFHHLPAVNTDLFHFSPQVKKILWPKSWH